ncbi:BadF/BadG/BcrA/BcrD ATPase family protein [Paenibacillus sp. FJAT-27812]|uniref:N-acetylglucosamine kinase n=1 Tax=Paenibacillus sp. FJAT-27812 TaxID=1684143 RepID=UPI0006A7C281|nr:BadF/BadG/BcrA/BcrD ATPase family protein [Paenibacillus sp. FJAT-27812]
MTYYLGVDGGGSKTIAVVSDEAGRVIGVGESGCGNHQIGVELARGNIQSAVIQALRQAEVNKEDIAYAVFGLAGADREADFQVLRPMIAKLGFENHDIVCDTVIGLRAGTKQSDGVVVICGSGTNSFGVNRQGESVQCGGFGYAFGDFGGGSGLAVEVFRSVIRSWEGREQETLLTGLTLQMLGYDSVEPMYNDYLDHGKTIPHLLAKLLFEAAEGGDVVAKGILQRQGEELGKAASAIIRKLSMQSDVFDLVMVGSVLTRGDSSYIAPFIEQQVQKEAAGCSLTVLAMEPVAGAILLAMDKTEMTIEESVYACLHECLSVKEAPVEWALD